RHRSFDKTYSGRTAPDPSGTSNSLFLDQVLDPQLATIYSHRYPIGPQISTDIGSVLTHNHQYSTKVDETLFNHVARWAADEEVYGGYRIYTVTFNTRTVEAGV